MRHKEILLNTQHNSNSKSLYPSNVDDIDVIGDNHVSTSYDTPLSKNAFDKTDAQKKQLSFILEKLWKLWG